MVLGIVQAHGGAVVVESKLGHGSTFRVYLPSLSPSPSREALRS
jgi:signal transduction histidine kinase